jgi:hypothetical protein
VFGAPVNLVPFLPQGKFQGNQTLLKFIRIVAPQPIYVPLAASGNSPVKGIADGIKDGGLARAGLPGDEKDVNQTGKIYFSGPKKGAEVYHG